MAAKHDRQTTALRSIRMVEEEHKDELKKLGAKQQARVRACCVRVCCVHVSVCACVLCVRVCCVLCAVCCVRVRARARVCACARVHVHMHGGRS